MVGKHWMWIAAVAGPMLIGCDRFKDSAAKTDAGESQGATTATTPASQTTTGAHPGTQSSPATQPTDEPTRSLSISDGSISKSYDFPRARIRIDRDEKTAVVYSDDPKTAITPAHAGNSYYLVIPLTDESIQKLDGYQWHFKSPTSEHQESAGGVFLEGQRYHLQPSEVVAEFHGEGPIIHIGLDGDFFKFDTAEDASQGTLVHVKGMLSARVDVK